MKNRIQYFCLAALASVTLLICGAQTPIYPLKKSASGHYLVDQNNTPVPILGRTAWFVISQPVDDYKAFINNTVAHGYNAIEMHVLNHDPRGKNPPFNGAGDIPFLKRLDGSDWKGSLKYTDTAKEAPDLTTHNEAYWRYVDAFLSYCESRGVEVFFFPAYVGYDGGEQGWMQELIANGPVKSRAYGSWIANRYKNQKNLVWMLLGDMGHLNPAQKEAEGALIAGLKSVAGQQSAEYSAEGSPGQNSADQADFGNEMTLNGTYTWGQKEVGTVPALGRKGYARNPVLPSYLLEEPYDEEGPDGNKVNPNAIQPVRRFQWWGWLCTIGGYISGNGYVWPFNSPQWQQHLNTKGAKDMERLNNFIKSITWWKLVPSGLNGMKTLITAGGSDESRADYIAAAATPEGTLLVAYVPPAHKGGITVNMTAINDTAQASWYDPTSGTFTKIAGSPFANKGNRQFIPPAKNHDGSTDWVLVLETPGAAGNRQSAMQPPVNGPLRHSRNPNYFEDASGKALILCGSQTWNTLQDWGSNGSIQKLDFNAFVSFLKGHGHNFTLLWSTELPKFAAFPTTETSPPDITVSPFPWIRTGPGLATDGGLKFDLTKFDQNYFDLLRSRVKTLDSAGIYAGVYLFSAEWLLRFRCPTDGYPFSGGNNVNGIDDGYRDGPEETWVNAVTMTAPNNITAFQDAFVKKTINTLNDLPNVLWIVSQESPEKSTWWNDHLVSLTRSYEKEKPFQHPIGYGVPSAFDPRTDSALNNSDADWVAPWARVSPVRSCGTGKPACKVNINDSDHSYWEIWKDSVHKHRNYVWENFTRGNQVLFMDPYLIYYPRQGRNLCISPVNAIGSQPDLRWESIRNNMGYILQYSRRVNLTNLVADTTLSSTKYCLAQTPSSGAEYVAYTPAGGSFTMNLSAMPGSRKLAVEWFNPSTGETIAQNPVSAGSPAQSFTPPFSGDAVLYLVDVVGHR